MIRQIRKIFSYAAVAVMTLLIGVGSYTGDVSAKDADGNIVIVIDPGHGGTDPGKGVGDFRKAGLGALCAQKSAFAAGRRPDGCACPVRPAAQRHFYDQIIYLR